MTVVGFLRDHTVAVTGAQGTIGQCLVQRLTNGGVRRIVALSRRPCGPTQDINTCKCVEQVGCDILSLPDLSRVLAGCTLVFHLAAVVHAGRAEQDPLRAVKTNALGTAHVLEACRRLNIRQVIYASTGHVYGLPRSLPVTEDHETAPVSIYGSTKLAGEAMVRAYAISYGLSTVIARMANVYGASFRAESVLGCMLQQLVNGGPICVSNFNSVRDFLYINDAVEGLIRLAALTDGSSGCHITNISTGRGVSIRELAETLVSVAIRYGIGRVEITETDRIGVDPVPKLVLDNGRLLELTGWRPTISLDEGLALTLREFVSEIRDGR